MDNLLRWLYDELETACGTAKGFLKKGKTIFEIHSGLHILYFGITNFLYMPMKSKKALQETKKEQTKDKKQWVKEGSKKRYAYGYCENNKRC